MPSTGLWALLLVLVPAVAAAAELGDINGDGRVSFGDSYLLRRWLETGLEEFRPAEGSTDFGGLLPCTEPASLPEFLFHEALRRTVPDAPPHFIESLEFPPHEETEAPVDPNVRFAVAASTHASGEGDALLNLRLESVYPLDAYAFVLEAEGLDIRPRYPPEVTEWRGVTSSQYYLLTRGRVAFRAGGLEAGEHMIAVPLTVPRGTAAGSYPVRLAAGTEVVTAFGDVVRPEVIEGMLEVTEAVSRGVAQEPPPLRLDTEARRVLGRVEYRASTTAGSIGDIVSVKVELRMDMPLNRIRFTVGFDHRALRVEEVVPLYRDQEHGEPVAEDFFFVVTNIPGLGAGGGSARIDYRQFLAQSHPWVPYLQVPNRDPSLKYVGPLGEWLEFVELRLRIVGGQRGPTPVLFLESQTFQEFLPYLSGAEATCLGVSEWSYEAPELTDGAVDVLDGSDEEPVDEPPVDPETANLRFTVGEIDAEGEPVVVTARPGDEVLLPVYFETDVPVWLLWLVYGFEIEKIQWVGMDVNFLDPDGSPYMHRVAPGISNMYTNSFCERTPPDPIPTCTAGRFPWRAWLHIPPFEPVPADVFLLEHRTTYRWANWRNLGAELAWEPGVRYELGSLVVKVREDAPAGRTTIFPRSLEWYRNGAPFPITTVTSAHGFSAEEPDLENVPIEALTVRSGVIEIITEDPPFVRGDTNGDGGLQLTDAVRLLESLFRGGGALDCEDAADADDDGRLVLTDAVYSLRFQFAGGRAPPAPFPEPGNDPTEDGLDCRRR